MPSPLVDLSDVTPGDLPKATATLASVRLAEIRDPEGPDFAAAYAMLASFFLDSGELEPRDALAGFVRDRLLDYGDGADASYHLLGAWAGEELVGVRDCYVEIDRRLGACVVALSHAYVVPGWRRSGLAALLRALPLTLGRRGTSSTPATGSTSPPDGWIRPSVTPSRGSSPLPNP